MAFRLCLAFVVMTAVFSVALCAADAADDDEYGGALGSEVEQGELKGSTGQQSPSPGGILIEEEDEWAMPSETARMFLQSDATITYPAMGKNPPAPGPGKTNAPHNDRMCGAGMSNCRG